MAYQYDPRDFADPRIEETREYNEELKVTFATVNKNRALDNVKKMLDAGIISQRMYEKQVTGIQRNYRRQMS